MVSRQEMFNKPSLKLDREETINIDGRDVSVKYYKSGRIESKLLINRGSYNYHTTKDDGNARDEHIKRMKRAVNEDKLEHDS